MVRWSRSYWDFPHCGTDRNMYIESFHNVLKLCFLNRRPKRRKDDLINVLSDVEAYYFQRSKQPKYLMQLEEDLANFISRHTCGMKIEDCQVSYISDSETYFVESQDPEKIKVAYAVKQVALQCLETNCKKCDLSPCRFGVIPLCEHMFRCDCPDNYPICKHIHKVYAMTIKYKNDALHVHNANRFELYEPTETAEENMDDPNLLLEFESHWEPTNQNGNVSPSFEDDAAWEKIQFYLDCLKNFMYDPDMDRASIKFLEGISFPLNMEIFIFSLSVLFYFRYIRNAAGKM